MKDWTKSTQKSFNRGQPNSWEPCKQVINADILTCFMSVHKVFYHNFMTALIFRCTVYSFWTSKYLLTIGNESYPAKRFNRRAMIQFYQAFLLLLRAHLMLYFDMEHLQRQSFSGSYSDIQLAIHSKFSKMFGSLRTVTKRTVCLQLMWISILNKVSEHLPLRSTIWGCHLVNCHKSVGQDPLSKWESVPTQQNPIEWWHRWENWEAAQVQELITKPILHLLWGPIPAS